ncbi:glycoside hydrolase family 13 protein [Tomitella cavernea]|uniref:Glycoside hydrolase family 13 protein n=1 Tax=Tomitella cavernea TaxID=1387982 RepID=A0ABP9CSB8_9ACTN|nr:glycoside hydrolase family 13 protein [Tomitella cavernea]
MDTAARVTDPAHGNTTAWWRTAAIYQVYIRSFADDSGDGVGDIAGLRRRLPYLAELGIDAVWINPWYRSPMHDAGYDVADYRDIDPLFGTLDEAQDLIDAAHALGIRVILDLVPNHVSHEHPWFREALASPPGSPARDRFHFRSGDAVPNDWVSPFGGPAWTRTTNSDGTPGQWYLHLFTPEQPDLNWNNPEVRAEFLRTLRFWFDRGVDGFRIDVAHALHKAPGLPDLDGLPYPVPRPEDGSPPSAHPFFDRDEVHAIYREWRTLANSYDPPRVFVAEAWVNDPARLARYVRPDELHGAFNFDFLLAPWKPDVLKAVIDRSLDSHAAVGALPTWVLSNHDGMRHVSKLARPQTDTRVAFLSQVRDDPADLALGERRARAAALLMFALPGGVYIYQGDELGLPEVEDLPDAALRDPIWERSGHTERGRDGCRVPLPWSGDRPPYGFSPDGAAVPPWLPQPDDWAPRTAAAQDGDPSSMLELYRTALRLRRTLPADAPLRWLPAPDGVLHFSRGDALRCLVNLTGDAVAAPVGEVLLASGPLRDDGTVPPDTAVWAR